MLITHDLHIGETTHCRHEHSEGQNHPAERGHKGLLGEIAMALILAVGVQGWDRRESPSEEGLWKRPRGRWVLL
ncbi:MAG: hypothetical protein CMF21_00065 [Idiomarinaceae bacterium]|nr:hypothetical protein [Idiomarinaceae bacterium]